MERGAILVAARDTSGTLSDPLGIDVMALIAFKEQGHSLRDYPHGEKHGILFEYIDERIRTNTRLALAESRASGELPRRAALALAERRVRAAMRTRRWV